jgi:hypothetical protein
MNQKQFKDFYDVAGLPYNPPKEEFERKFVGGLMKRQETPKEFKIGRKDFQPGYAAYNQHLRTSGQKIPIIGDNYRNMLAKMELFNPQQNNDAT